MNIAVSGAENLPPRAYLSLRVGDTRQQAPYQKGQVFHFPAGHRNVVVDVFEHVGSARAALRDPCTVSQGQHPQHVDIDVWHAWSAPMRVALAVEPCAEDGPQRGAVQGAPREQRKKAPVSNHAALKAARYLEEHRVKVILQDMMHMILAEQPHDSIGFMIGYLGGLRGGGQAPRTLPLRADAGASRGGGQPPGRKCGNLAECTPRPGMGDQEYPGFAASGGYPKQLPDLSGHHSMSARAVRSDPSLYYGHIGRATEHGVTLAKCLKPGMDDPGSPSAPHVGLCAGDEYCYDMFRDIFDAVIKESHGLGALPPRHKVDGDTPEIANEILDPSGGRDASVAVSLSRSLARLKFPPACSREGRRAVERMVVRALLTSPPCRACRELEGGEYFPLHGSQSYPAKLGGMDATETARLRGLGVLPGEPSGTAALAAGTGRHWPDARGVFMSAHGTVAVVVNDADHVRIQVRLAGLDLGEAFSRASGVERALGEALHADGHGFARNDRLGYLCACPSQTGTALVASARLRLPLLGVHPEFAETCRGMGLAFVPTACGGGVWDVSSGPRLGVSDADQLREAMEKYRQLIQLEHRLGQGEVLPSPLLAQAAAACPPRPPDDAAEEEQGDSFGDVPGLGDDDYPGFPADLCPEEMPDLSGHFSCMATALKGDPSIYGALRARATGAGVTLARVIKTGIDNRGHPMFSSVGLVAGDEECYTVFRPLFDPVIRALHGHCPDEAEPCRLEGDRPELDLQPLDSSRRYVVSVQVQVARNISGIRFLPACSREERDRVEGFLARALLGMTAEFQGEYFPLAGSDSYAPRRGGMAEEAETALEGDEILMEEPEAGIVLAAGIGRHWPHGRGVFATASRSVWAWVNEKDHLRLTVNGTDSDLQSAFLRLRGAEREIRNSIQKEGHDFARCDRLGFLATSPANIGTGLSARVVVDLPLLGDHPDFRALCRRLTLEAWPLADNRWKISNLDRLLSSEVEQVNAVVAGCGVLFEAERRLELGEPIQLADLGPGVAEECEEWAEESDEDTCPEAAPDPSVYNSHMADVFGADPSLYERLGSRVTENGVTLANVIKPGLAYKGHSLVKIAGVVAGDEDSYTVFGDLLGRAVSRRHALPPGGTQHVTDLDPAQVDAPPIDPAGAHVQSVSLRAARNLRNFRLAPRCSFEERRRVEEALVGALSCLAGGLEGKYYPLPGSGSCAQTPDGMAEEDEARLQEARLLFDEPDAHVMVEAGFARHWPDARGVFAGDDPDFAAWVNNEEHLCLLVQRPGADLGGAFSRLCRAHRALETALSRQGHSFMHSERYGFLSASLDNLGTGLRVSVTMVLPLLHKHDSFYDICKRLRVLPYRSAGVWEMQNADCLGTSEVELISTMARSCRHLVELEQALGRGEAIVLSGLGCAPLCGFPADRCPAAQPRVPGCRSILAQVLQMDASIYSELRDRQTPGGVTFAQVIKPGMDMRCQNAPCGPPALGMVAGDAESYSTFARLFEASLEASHRRPVPAGPHPLDLDPGAVATGGIAAIGRYIKTVRVCGARNLAGFGMPPACSRDERREVERILSRALYQLPGKAQGNYFPLVSSDSYAPKPGGMSAEDRRNLHAEGLLVPEPCTRVQLAAGVGRDWPDARGVFVDREREVAAWINGDEHLQLIALRRDADLVAAFRTFCDAARSLDLALDSMGHRFSRNDRLGFLTAWPERLGTGLQVSVTLRVPKLASRADLPDVCARHGLAIITSGGGHGKATINVMNACSFGVSEASLVSGMIDRCSKLIELERES